MLKGKIHKDKWEVELNNNAIYHLHPVDVKQIERDVDNIEYPEVEILVISKIINNEIINYAKIIGPSSVLHRLNKI